MTAIKFTPVEFKKILEDAYGVIIDDNPYYIDENYELSDCQLVTAFIQLDNSDISEPIIIPPDIEQNNNVIYNPIFKTFFYENSNIPPFRILKVFTP